MDQKVNFKAEKQNYPKGSIIILQGSSSKEIYFLHTGIVEIKRFGQNLNGLSDKEIIESSKRVGVIEAPSIFGIQNLISSGIHQSSYIALNDCQITKYVIPSNDFVSFFKANPPISMNVLLTMQEQARKRLVDLKRYIDFIGLIDKVIDNLMLLYLHINNIKKDELYKKFTNNGGVFSSKIEPSFLTSDFSMILGKTYGDPAYDPKVKFEYDKIDFFQSLLKANPSSFISLLSKDSKIFIYIFHCLTNIITAINIEAEKFISRIEGKLNTFFLDNSSPFNLIYSSIKVFKNSDGIDNALLSSIVKLCRNIEHIYKQFGGKEYIEVFSKYDVISTGAGFVAEPNKTDRIQTDGVFKKKFKDSVKVILSFSTLPENPKSKILKNLDKVRKLVGNEDLLSKEYRNLIKNLQDDYYELYENIFFKIVKNPGPIPDAVKLFLYYSFIDENLVTEEQLEFLNNSLFYYTSKQNTDYPIITLFDYLMLIYNKEEEPSLSERGEFRKIVTKMFLKNEKKVEDTPAGRVDFEIAEMVRMSMRITSDNIRAYIPYLREVNFKGNLSQVLVNPKKLDTFMKKIVSLDYSLFFRELTWKIPGKSELIQKEIKPYLILMPNSGMRVQMWQELVYNMRSSRSRFLIPIIFNGDLLKNLIFSCGHFRWNLNKAMVSNWMDPVEGGLTGAYYDYEMSYKKNPDLTIEAKEKIKKQISSIKIDRNRFAHDYYEWLVFESEGVPKLNKILRKIFYRLIPFPRNIRDNISKLPVYSELDRKFNIIRDRDFKKIEARFKKYMEAGQMPEDLQAFLELMQK